MELIQIINEAIPLEKEGDLKRRLDLYAKLSKPYDKKKLWFIVQNAIPLRSCAFKRNEDKLRREFLIEKLKELNTIPA